MAAPTHRPRPWWLLAPILVLVGAAALRLWLLQGLDLGDHAGPGGVKILTALATGDLDRDWMTRTVAALLPIIPDPLRATRLVVLAGSLLSVVGAMLAGQALAGRRAAVFAGIVAACWSQGVFSALLVGPDAPAQGLAWLGVGLAWWGARQGHYGLVAVLLGALSAAYGVALKVNAAPALGLLLLAPVFVPVRRPLQLLGVALVLGTGLYLAWLGFLPRNTGQVQEVPVPDMAGILGGLQAIAALPDQRHPAATPLIQLGWVALAGALLPGPRWLTRLVVALAGAVVLGFTAMTVSDLLRPRYLLVAALPVVVLVGALPGLLLDGLAALLRRRGRAITPVLSVLVAMGLALPILFDSLAFLEAWNNQRMALVGASSWSLPRAPEGWRRRYQRMSQLDFSDTSEIGALSLTRLAEQAPPGGVATVPLRDAREFHLRAGASLAGHPHRILEARSCCGGEASPACATEVVQALDAAGARLVLPVPVQGVMRVPRAHERWWTLLRAAAEEAGGVETHDRWWVVREPRGSGGELPCPVPGADAPAPRPGGVKARPYKRNP